jgi:hypothetical protein
MRQNIGLFFLTAGSIILSFCLFPKRLIASWKQYPWEQRLFLRLMGNRSAFEDRNEDVAYMNRIESDAEFRKLEMKRAKRRERIRTDWPIIAFVMMVIGFFLCFNYSAF